MTERQAELILEQLIRIGNLLEEKFIKHNHPPMVVQLGTPVIPYGKFENTWQPPRAE